MNWYQESIDTVLKHFNTNAQTGLTSQEVQQRLQQDGPNVLPEGKQASWFTIFLSQFTNPLIYILLAAAAIIYFFGADKTDAFIISCVLLFNAIIGTIQEGRTHNIIESLKRFIHTTILVVRDGQKKIVEDSDVVVGDIILIKEGQRIPADARIIESDGIRVDEAVLTGESTVVEKTVDALEGMQLIADQRNMLFRGTYVMAGFGKAVIVATGRHTEIGKIQRAVESISTDIPLKKELERLAYSVLLFILVSCGFLFLLGAATGKPLQELLTMLTALFICVVPEGLPVVLTLVLVSGAYRMAKQNVLIKNLQAVETLGRTDVVVIDKTGTLTRNEMLLSHVCTPSSCYHVSGEGYYVEGQVLNVKTDKPVELAGQMHIEVGQIGVATSLLNNTEITFIPEQRLFELKGDPTEAALFIFSQKLGLDRQQLEKGYLKKYEFPFDSKTKIHAGFYEHDGQGVAFVIGAPEAVFARCLHVGDVDFELKRLLEDGLRIVAVAQKKFSSHPTSQGDYQAIIESGLEYLGICGIQDSIRPDVAPVIAQARKTGMDVIMATGDHKETALYVAKKVGIYRDGDEVVDGSQFAGMSDEVLLEKLGRVTVFSRVSPQDKMRIIELLHKKGKIVAMTGDGINDAPSLIAADLGIAMGNIGTEVAKQASDVVLFDDSFVNIMSAVKEGRHVFYTLRRVVLYFFSTNMGEIFIVFFGLFSGLPLPLTAAQILWLNLVTDGFLDVALSTEPQESGLLGREWLERKPVLVDKYLLGKMFFIAIPMGLVSLLVFSHYYQIDVRYARTMTLVTMAMFQWFNAWNCRSERQSIFQLGLFTNKWLIAATAFVLFLQFAILHVSFMQQLFKTVPLSAHDWLVVLSASAPIVVIEEIRKWVVRRWWPRQQVD